MPILLIFLVLFTATTESRTVYRYEDAEGRVLFTDDPRKARGMSLIKTFRFSYKKSRSGSLAPPLKKLKQRIAQYRPLIDQAAQRYDLDADLIHAIILAESAYNLKALSPKGAMGLMQLMPATAKRFGVNDVWNAEQNIMGGSAYLAWLKRYFDQDMDKVIAAYNAGEGTVKKYQGIPPYKETRHYVHKVKEFWQKGLAAFD